MKYQALMLGLMFAVAATSQVTEMTIKVVGPRSVYRGYPLQLGLTGTVVKGTDIDLITVYHSRLPVGISSSWSRGCCTDSQIYRVTYPQILTLMIGNNAPLGRQTLTITYSTPSGVRGEAVVAFDILDTPKAPVLGTPPPNEELWSEAVWKQQMRKGNQFCYQPFASETSVWYYDSARVYYNLNDTLQSEYYTPCAEFQIDAYRRYVLDANGLVPGYRYFPHGLATHYLKTGDPQSFRAVRLMMNNPNVRVTIYTIDPMMFREVSYGVDVHLQNERMGRPRHGDFDALLEVLLGDFEQFFISRQYQWQPFMVALGSEALIDYWQTSRDPRILPILQRAADLMWTESWSSRDGAFAYTLPDGTLTFESSADLNLLIAPLYGWLYQQTYDTKYRTRGDTIFTEGVTRAWLDGGKQFSQNYRWSNKYIEWRKLSGQAGTGSNPTPPTPVPAPAPVLKSLSPTAGTGLSQTFALAVDEVTGAQNLSLVSMSIGTSNQPASNCQIAIAPRERTVSLTNDAGTAVATVSLDSGSVLENSQCAISPMAISLTIVGTTTTFQIPITFRATYAGLKNINVNASNVAPASSATQTLGTFSVATPSAVGLPVLQSLSPASSTGMSQTFTVEVDEPTGARNLQFISIAVDSVWKTNAGCALTLDLPGQSATLWNDAGSAVRYGVMGSNSVLSNRQCSVALSAVSYSAQARRLTAQVTIAFDPTYRGQKLVFVNAGNVFLRETGAKVLGTINVN